MKTKSVAGLLTDRKEAGSRIFLTSSRISENKPSYWIGVGFAPGAEEAAGRFVFARSLFVGAGVPPAGE
jgi:hypothetical protein